MKINAFWAYNYSRQNLNLLSTMLINMVVTVTKYNANNFA